MTKENQFVLKFCFVTSNYRQLWNKKDKFVIYQKDRNIYIHKMWQISVSFTEMHNSKTIKSEFRYSRDAEQVRTPKQGLGENSDSSEKIFA